MSRPRLLDLYCCAGGAATGYHPAGFDVTGIDHKPQPNYPFTFVLGDALEYLEAHGHEYDAVHASPPCQVHSALGDLVRRQPGRGTSYDDRHADLIPQTRALLQLTGLPYIIENVPGALKALRSPIMLCGNMFGLKVYRHRLFESNVMLLAPTHQKHLVKALGKGYTPKSGNEFVVVTGKVGASILAQKAMGIDWMSTKRIEDRTSEASQAVPPAYTEYLGRQLIRFVESMFMKGIS